MVGVHRSLLICDRLTCLLLRGDTAAAEQCLTKQLLSFMKAMKNNPTILRCQYAVARLLKQDDGEAQEVMKRFELCAKTHPFVSDIESEREIIAAIDTVKTQ
jgi:hypothetical protein